ncbi:nitrate reductase molybdenum cofactor assembly chaperone [Salisediminibacterium halotolerans]|uniref:Nitrate reductase delta subunit n=1 Tax=Salisediminibacterium halotolerans TaxID=517425 RepID=A0A1H9S411_9BACI|nr:nitrate reductase molybdenum cofactor assembly chaperone [Salisediminibacterium haloalkalitolerans]SER78879.1 nitrate reductase delta subunit [Salisediminibacterium haloalkalitolerans]
MKKINQREMYQMISFLLQYPSEEVYKALPEMKEAAAEMKHPQLMMQLNAFSEWVRDQSFAEWEQHYIDMFDFGKNTNLYVTYDLMGEDKERGLQLLKLKQHYENAGFTVIDDELPDYLPVMLEFAAAADEEAVQTFLQTYLPAVSRIREKLVTAQSGYTFLFDALLVTMEEQGIREAV